MQHPAERIIVRKARLILRHLTKLAVQPLDNIRHVYDGACAINRLLLSFTILLLRIYNCNSNNSCGAACIFLVSLVIISYFRS